MTTYDATQWHDMFVMAGGASAALAGLIFVAVSLNHEQVLANSGLPLVAARTLAILVSLVILCVLCLAPGQSPARLGGETLSLGIVLAVWVAVSTARSNSGTALEQLDDWVVGALATVPTIVAGISLIARAGGGMVWVMIETITALLGAVYYAWLLLIEIRR